MLSFLVQWVQFSLSAKKFYAMKNKVMLWKLFDYEVKRFIVLSVFLCMK